MHAEAPAPSPLQLPSIAVVILGLIAGALTVLIHTSFGISAPWANYGAITLVFLAVLGINPLVGSAFRNSLHLSPAVTIVITAVLTAGAVAATQLSLSSTDVGIIQGIIAFAGALGFGTVPVAAAAKGRYI